MDQSIPGKPSAESHPVSMKTIYTSGKKYLIVAVATVVVLLPLGHGFAAGTT